MHIFSCLQLFTVIFHKKWCLFPKFHFFFCLFFRAFIFVFLKAFIWMLNPIKLNFLRTYVHKCLNQFDRWKNLFRNQDLDQLLICLDKEGLWFIYFWKIYSIYCLTFFQGIRWKMGFYRFFAIYWHYREHLWAIYWCWTFQVWIEWNQQTLSLNFYPIFWDIFAFFLL